MGMNELVDDVIAMEKQIEELVNTLFEPHLSTALCRL